MYAMVLAARGAPLVLQERPDPVPGPGEVRVKVGACGVCRTDLHVVDGELPDLSYPIIPGHEVVGRIDALGDGVTELPIGRRVGVPGSAARAATVPIAARARKISAIVRSSPATPATAASPPTSLPTLAIASRSESAAMPWLLPRSFVPD